MVARPGEDIGAVLTALDTPEQKAEPLVSPAPASLADWRALLRPGDAG